MLAKPGDDRVAPGRNLRGSAPEFSGSRDSAPTALRLFGFALLILCWSNYYSRTYVIGRQSTTVEVFSMLTVPLVTLLLNLAAITFLPYAAYVLVTFADYVFLVAIATHHDSYRDNLDIHLLLQNWREGFEVAGHIAESVPWRLAMLGLAVAVTQCYLARGLRRGRATRVLLVLLIGLLAPAYAFALHREPLRRAALNQDYALCIKLYGYYGAVLGDLLFSGVVPSQSEMLEQFLATQSRSRPKKTDTCIPNLGDRSVLALQIESLDYEALDVSMQGRPVTPFLASLKKAAHFLRVDPLYTTASSSSGADFQVLTGFVPDPSFPAYSLNTLDYGQALPNLFATMGIDSFAFVGVTPNFFSQGAGFQRAGFKRHYDQLAYPSTLARWGIDDESFFAFNSQILNERKARTFYLMITLSSHGPFNFVKRRTFEEGGIAGRYFNAINYVDAAIETFLQGLQGRYLVLLYGDHSSRLRLPEYGSGHAGGDSVPGFVFFLDHGDVSRPIIVGDDKTNSAVPMATLYWWLRNSVLGPCESPSPPR